VEASRRARAQTRRVRRVLWGVGIGLALLVLVGAVVAALMWRRAEGEAARAVAAEGTAAAERALAVSRGLAAQAERQAESSNAELALLLAVEAGREAETSEAYNALCQALSHMRTQAILRGHEDWVVHAAWSLDGRRILTASPDGTARVWDGETGEEVSVLRGHEGMVRHAAWSPDGRRIATASPDGTARVWDGETGEAVSILRGHEDVVWHAAWSPDGRRIATAGGDDTARIWIAQIEDLLAYACQRAVRNMTREEWGRFMDGPYRATCPNLPLE